MIPFASQRGLGQDLASHLLNENDNEYMEVLEIKGAIAGDLHGAFAEWEAQAHALTKCRNYLYSLSVNPDDRQGPLTREQYFEYIDRVEEKLGLSGQPRAVVNHIKDGREHIHVVWSRIDAWNEKAVHMAFDHDKLMMVTKEFARDHGLELPDGYFKEKGAEKSRQVTVYEKALERATGLTKEDHIEQVTDAWRASDNAQAFVRALAEKGYMLARGDRPYVLVDFYGGMYALPRLIGDKTVRSKDIQDFLGSDYPPDSLPSVEEAKALIAEHRQSIEAHLKSEQRADALADLKRLQIERRQKQEQEHQELKDREGQERRVLADQHRMARADLRAGYLSQSRAIKMKRYQHRPTGLAAFLGRVTGVELIRNKFHKNQDRKRFKDYLEAREILKQEQRDERLSIDRRHEMQGLDMQRKIRALDRVDAKELKSLNEALRKEVRILARGGRNQMPSLGLELHPPGRKAMPHKAKNRYRSRLPQDQFNKAQSGEPDRKDLDLSGDFKNAAGDSRSDGEGEGSSEGLKPASKSKIRRSSRRRRRNRDRDPGRGR